MNCPNADWDLLATESLKEEVARPLLSHLQECPACRGAYEQARRAHLSRIRMYDQFDRGHDGLREQLMAALPSAPARSPADRWVRGWRHMGEAAMSFKNRPGARTTFGVVAAAACVILAVLFTTSSGGQSAFAAAIERFHTARTITCQVSMPTPISVSGMSIRQSGTLYIASEFGSRFENYGNGVLVAVQYVPLNGPMTLVNPLARNYMVLDTEKAGGGSQAANNPEGFILALSKLQGQANRELGHATLGGVDAVGYEIAGQALGFGSGEHVRSELWVDAKTHLPVRYVAEMPSPQDGSPYQLVYEQFVWDQPLDPKLFVPEIPDGYTRLDARMPAPDEDALVKGLGNYSELTGKYPTTLDLASIVTDLASAVASRTASTMAKGEPAPDQQMLTQKSIEIGSGVAFYQTLVSNGRSPEYYGKEVSPGQADAVLLRWKLDDGQWRVIYGDLRTATEAGE
jgi:outer membrane lipoprotein-sorting protein